AGAEPARMSEEGPQLRKFLTWLETDKNGEGGAPATGGHKTPVPGPATGAQRIPRPSVTPPPKAPAEGGEGKHAHGSKKHKRHKHPGGAGAPVAAAPAPAARVAEIDVELVPAAPPPVALAPEKRSF